MKNIITPGNKFNKERDYYTTLEIHIKCAVHNQIPLRQHLPWGWIGAQFTNIHPGIMETTSIPNWRYGKPVLRTALI